MEQCNKHVCNRITHLRLSIFFLSRWHIQHAVDSMVDAISCRTCCKCKFSETFFHVSCWPDLILHFPKPDHCLNQIIFYRNQTECFVIVLRWIEYFTGYALFCLFIENWPFTLLEISYSIIWFSTIHRSHVMLKFSPVPHVNLHILMFAMAASNLIQLSRYRMFGR